MQSELLGSHDCQTAAPAIRRIMGCDAPRETPFEFGGLSIDRCPLYYASRASGWVSQASELYAFKEKGIMPHSGGYLDQPNKVVEMFLYLDYLFLEKTKKDMK